MRRLLALLVSLSVTATIASCSARTEVGWELVAGGGGRGGTGAFGGDGGPPAECEPSIIADCAGGGDCRAACAAALRDAGALCPSAGGSCPDGGVPRIGLINRSP